MNSILSANLRRGISQSLRSQRSTRTIFSNNKIAIQSQSSTTLNNHGRTFSSLPDHEVVGMPALSPTMEAGTIATWNVTEGQSFVAGDSLAEIETDKATMDFEAQDDGVVAKILMEAGSNEINVGVPIVVTVEDEDDVAAFKDFVAPDAEAAPVVEAAAPAPVVEEVAPPAPVAAPVAAPVVTVEPTPVVAAPAAAPAVVLEPVVPAVPADDNESTVSPGWGNFARVRSPLASTLSASQKKYIELYGPTGQTPL
jgi:pyruvate dehydrogenase E2 component (dihydrolipoamide acetyltransferase)